LSFSDVQNHVNIDDENLYLSNNIPTKELGSTLFLTTTTHTHTNTIEHTNLQGQQKRKDCQTETPIDLCKLKIGVVRY
jgi:hypothetical protein